MSATHFIIALSAVAFFHVVIWLQPKPTLLQSFIGFFTNFLDTLGIGSFATTTSTFKLSRMVPDEEVPGTLNVGHTLPTIVEACIYMTIVQIGLRTLITLIGAAVLGAWFGAGIVSRWPRRKIQIGMGLALLAAAGFMLMRQFSLFPSQGGGLDLDLTRLALGACGNFVLGALMTLGIGLYAPCMVLVSFLGMDTKDPMAAYPIMMGSCAFLMPVSSFQFIRNKRYSLRPSLGLTLGGIPGVLLAAYVFYSLPVEYVRWVVILVVVYTATRMLHSARVEKIAAGNPAAKE